MKLAPRGASSPAGPQAARVLLIGLAATRAGHRGQVGSMCESTDSGGRGRAAGLVYTCMSKKTPIELQKYFGEFNY